MKHCFIERQPEFGWHRDMLLDDCRMQISFLKDLVTQRDPTSRFTFINYLFERGRLNEFVNLKNFYPTRVEFHDYLSWVAQAFDDRVHYGQTRHGHRTGVRSERRRRVRCACFADEDGREWRRVTKALSVGVGGTARVPEAFACARAAQRDSFVGVSEFDRARRGRRSQRQEARRRDRRGTERGRSVRRISRAAFRMSMRAS